MHHRIACIAIAIAAVLAVYPSMSVAADQSQYVDPARRFSFIIPDGYDPLPPESLALIFVPDNPPVAYSSTRFRDAGFTITVRMNDAVRRPLVQVAVEAISMMVPQSPANASPLLSNPIQGTSVSQRPAVQIDYNTMSPIGRMHVQQVAVQNGSALYVFTFTAHEEDFSALSDDVSVVVSSFALQ